MQAYLSSWLGTSTPPPLNIEGEIIDYPYNKVAPVDFLARVANSEDPVGSLVKVFYCLQSKAERKSNPRLHELHKAVKAGLQQKYKLSPTVLKLRKRIIDDPKHMKSHLRLGQLFKSDNPEKGIKQDDAQVKLHLEIVVEAHPNDPVVLAAYGDYLRMRNSQRASGVLQMAARELELTPDNVIDPTTKASLKSFIFASRANLALCNKDTGNAVRYLKIALETTTSHPFVQEVWNLFKRRQIDPGSAIDYFNDGSGEINPYNPLRFHIPVHYPAIEP